MPLFLRHYAPSTDPVRSQIVYYHPRVFPGVSLEAYHYGIFKELYITYKEK